MGNDETQFSAAQQALGYYYQPRYALLKLFQLPEETTCLIEGDDDVDFSDPSEGKILASLKHKAAGDKLTDLSPDFWKSVRIWLTYFNSHPDDIQDTSFFLFTTGRVCSGSYLENFVEESTARLQPADLAKKAVEILGKTRSKTLLKTKSLLGEVDDEQRSRFFSRITIFDCQDRIDEIPDKIMGLMRTERREFRKAIYQRLEGWWTGECINLLTQKRNDPLNGR